MRAGEGNCRSEAKADQQYGENIRVHQQRRDFHLHDQGMGLIAYLADFTRKWCSGGTKSFDLLRRGSSPLFLRIRRDFNPHVSLYQSGPINSGTSPLKLGRNAGKGNGKSQVPDDQGKSNRQKVLSYEMYELVVAEARVRGPDPEEDNGEQGGLRYQVSCREFGEGGHVVCAQE